MTTHLAVLKLKDKVTVQEVTFNLFFRVAALFIKQEEENFALFNYVNELNNECETLKDQVKELTGKYIPWTTSRRWFKRTIDNWWASGIVMVA